MAARYKIKKPLRGSGCSETKGPVGPGVMYINEERLSAA